MKKIIIATALLLTASFGFSWSGPGLPSCPRCKELTTKYRKGYSNCLGCAMFRCPELEIGEHEGAIFKCRHGHTIWFDYKTGERILEKEFWYANKDKKKQ